MLAPKVGGNSCDCTELLYQQSCFRSRKANNGSILNGFYSTVFSQGFFYQFQYQKTDDYTEVRSKKKQYKVVPSSNMFQCVGNIVEELVYQHLLGAWGWDISQM